MAEGESERTWQKIERELSQERDPAKVQALIKELNYLLVEEERQKVLQRLGSKRSRPLPKA